MNFTRGKTAIKLHWTLLNVLEVEKSDIYIDLSFHIITQIL